MKKRIYLSVAVLGLIGIVLAIVSGTYQAIVVGVLLTLVAVYRGFTSTSKKEENNAR